MNDDLEKLSSDICVGARAAFAELFRAEEKFYYCVMVTTEEGHSPFISAWSHEALEREKQNNVEGPDYIEWVKWSYADSPYMDFSPGIFDNLKKIFSQRSGIENLSETGWRKEVNLRVQAMEIAMKTLDDEGIFSATQPRDKILINVEIIPPNFSNTQRAIRLNTGANESLKLWLDEAAEKS